MKSRYRATGILFCVAFIWGMTFIWMKKALTSAEVILPDVDGRWVAMHFVAFRFLIGTIGTLVILRASRSGFSDPESGKVVSPSVLFSFLGFSFRCLD